jgi:glyoxylase-like metal-dependent hydrolase (beta-lactamase superfamily II)
MIRVLAVRTPTIPPATHTNCYRVGDTVIDPASPYDDEQERLHAWLGPGVTRILLTHHHHDHVGGVEDLRARTGARVVAHVDARLPFPVDERISDGWDADTGDGRLRAHHTPGHADGHLVFQVDDGGDVICGDLVAGEGTIVLVPPEGDLQVYLDSLARVRPFAATLHPAHGPAQPAYLLDAYTRHRQLRTAQFEAVLAQREDASPREIAAEVYAGLPGVDLHLAALQVRTHLEWLARAGRAHARPGDRWARGAA